MNVFKYFANLYGSKDALFNHITLFSLVGLMMISISCYLSSVFGNIYGSFFDFVSMKPLELYLLFILAVMLFIFFVGYHYSTMNRMHHCEGSLPELSLVSYYVFIKMLPVLLVWKVYEFAFFGAGFVIFAIDSPVFYIYYSVLVCLLPFLSLIYAIYVKDFKFRAEIINPVTVFRVLNRSLGVVISLCLQTLILLIIPCVFGYLLLKYSTNIANPVLQSGVKLGGACVITYLFIVIKLAYNRGLVEIVKTKLSYI